MDDKNNVSVAVAIGWRLGLETNCFKTAAAALVCRPHSSPNMSRGRRSPHLCSLQIGAYQGQESDVCQFCGQVCKVDFVSNLTQPDRCYKMKLYLEQFNIPCCVLNSELPVATRLHTVNICQNWAQMWTMFTEHAWTFVKIGDKCEHVCTLYIGE